MDRVLTEADYKPLPPDIDMERLLVGEIWAAIYGVLSGQGEQRFVLGDSDGMVEIVVKRARKLKK